MGLVARFFGREGAPQTAKPSVRPSVHAEAGTFWGWDDPRLAEFMRAGVESQSGVAVTVETAMRNSAVIRCVSLISNAIGMLPLHLLRGDDFESDKATDHPLYDLLYAEPNNWQTAFDFRSHMQANALLHGNAYAMVVRSNGRVIRLVPLSPLSVEPIQRPDWSVAYRYTRPDGGRVDLAPGDVFHLRGISLDGINGLSMVRQAAEAIGLAIQTESAAARLFRNGMLIGGKLKHPERLSPEAVERLRQSMEERYASAENAHRWIILEEGMDAELLDHSAVDSQHIETRLHQIKEIGRVFGVPNPLLMEEGTGWGTGIDQLGIFFVRYGLSQWFVAWEQAIRRTLLVGPEKAQLKPKFNEGALLRGSMKDQAEFFARALGSGGHTPWMTVNEVRALQNLNAIDGGDDLAAPANSVLPGEDSDGAP